MGVHLLLDTKNGYPFIANNLGVPCETHVSPESKWQYFSWIKGSLNVLAKSRKNDLIICVYDFQAVLCHLFQKLAFRRRKILALNVLLKDKPTLRNKLAGFLYKLAFKSDDFVATVTTEEYGQWLNAKCGIKREFPILKDVCYNEYTSICINKSESVEEVPYIFCGGRNGRDWNFLISVAHSMPDIHFKVVMPSSIRDQLGDLPKNVDCLCDISSDAFNKIMSNALMIALPLNTCAPAGLIVLFQAACMAKPIIVTSTVATREYVACGRGIAVENRVDHWIEAIRKIIAQPEDVIAMTDKMRKYIREECNEEKYVERIRHIMHSSF